MTMILRSRNGFPYPFAVRRHNLSSLFDEQVAPSACASAGETSGVIATPRMNVVESEQQYVVYAEMPGVAKEDIKISVNGKRVSIEAAVKLNKDLKEGEKLVFSERRIEKYAREFSLANETDGDRTAAKFENGILTLTIAKKQEVQGKHITVQ